jgi:outer membrane protein, heavy metal efflux system
LGLTGPERHWTLGHVLPELPAVDPDPGLEEKVAIKRRLDLDESRREIKQLAEALEITRNYRWIGGASVGVSTERDPDGTRVTGPNFSVEIPIFDQRQAEIARLESLLAQSESRCAALEVAIRNEVRAAANRVIAARKIVEFYRDELIPAREQVVNFTQQEQNYMLVDVFELLFSRQQEAETYQGYIEGLIDYWVARAELAHAVGVGLPDVTNLPDTSSTVHHSFGMGNDLSGENNIHSNQDDVTHLSNEE